VEIKGKEEEVVLEAIMVMIEVSEGYLLIIDYAMYLKTIGIKGRHDVSIVRGLVT
jgi:hypothetical protein